MVDDLEKRIGDYLNKLEKPAGFKFWDRKRESYLTLSAKIEDQEGGAVEKIKQLQERVIKRVEGIKVINNPYDDSVECGLFKYPEDRLHFSLFNFLISHNDFDEFTGKVNNLKEDIVSLIRENKPQESRVIITGLHDGNNNGQLEKLDSITLQIFPEEKFLESLQKIEEKAKNHQDLTAKISSTPDVQSDLKIKCFKNKRGEIERCGINILRFLNFGNEEELENLITSNKLAEEIYSINEEFKQSGDKWFRFEIKKIILVESDPFLFKQHSVCDFYLN